MVPCKSTAKEVSFEWSHHRILSPDSMTLTLGVNHWCKIIFVPESFIKMTFLYKQRRVPEESDSANKCFPYS